MGFARLNPSYELALCHVERKTRRLAAGRAYVLRGLTGGLLVHVEQHHLRALAG
jgi:hypothetical protein